MKVYISNYFFLVLGETSTRKKKHRKENKRRRKMRFIPEGILEEIFIRLPVKSLCRFKWVSKSWRSLIESRWFVDSYRLRHAGDYPSESLVRTSLSSSSSSELELLKPHVLELCLPEEEECGRVFRTMGPLSNGIHCLVSYLEYGDRVSLADVRIELCNITTNSYKYANPFPCDDSLPCRIHFGFGTTSQGDYKAILIISWGPPFSSSASFVYRFKRGEWMQLADYEPGSVRYPEIVSDLELCPQRFCNGCWHWMAVEENGNCSVLSFNFDEEGFKHIGAPPGLQGYQRLDDIEPEPTNWALTGPSVLVLKDRLGAVLFATPGSVVQVWMMKEYGVEESWTKIWHVEPNFHGCFSRLVGIYWKPDEDDAIQSIIFQQGSSNQRLVECDTSGAFSLLVYFKAVVEIKEYCCLMMVGMFTCKPIGRLMHQQKKVVCKDLLPFVL